MGEIPGCERLDWDGYVTFHEPKVVYELRNDLLKRKFRFDLIDRPPGFSSRQAFIKDAIERGFLFRSDGQDCFWAGSDYLLPEVVDWCKQTNTQLPTIAFYPLHEQFYAQFSDDKHAVMFKLRWSDGPDAE